MDIDVVAKPLKHREIFRMKFNKIKPIIGNVGRIECYRLFNDVFSASSIALNGVSPSTEDWQPNHSEYKRIPK